MNNPFLFGSGLAFLAIGRGIDRIVGVIAVLCFFRAALMIVVVSSRSSRLRV